MSTPLSITDADEFLAGFPESDDGPRCEECGVSIEWSGRGFKPQYCKDHKRASSRNATGRSTVATDKIIDALTQLYVGAGVGLTFVDEFDGAQVVMNAAKLAESWRPLIDNDPKVKKALTKLVQSSGWGTVVVAHVMVAAPIIAHHGGRRFGNVSPMADMQSNGDE